MIRTKDLSKKWSFNLSGEPNVYEKVEQPLINLALKAAERKAMVERVLERMKVGIEKGIFHSKGVAIARAVVVNPKLIIADEPTSNMFPEMA